MRKLGGNRGRGGFTLGELLIVVAIIGVLVAVSIPIFSNQLERSRNAVDINNAKSYANAIQYYFMTNPSKMEELQKKCETSGSVHYVQMSVGQYTNPNSFSHVYNTVIDNILAEALQDAGLLQEIGKQRYSEITCKSKKEWKGYYIAVTTFIDGKTTDQIQIAYKGFNGSGNLHIANSYRYVFDPSTDPTTFSDKVTGK